MLLLTPNAALCSVVAPKHRPKVEAGTVLQLNSQEGFARWERELHLKVAVSALANIVCWQGPFTS